MFALFIIVNMFCVLFLGFIVCVLIEECSFSRVVVTASFLGVGRVVETLSSPLCVLIPLKKSAIGNRKGKRSCDMLHLQKTGV